MTDELRNEVEQRILYHKKLLVGKTKVTEWDKQPHNVYLDAEIKEIVGRKDKRSSDLKPLNRYKTLSISGHSKHFAGQIYDELTPENIDFKIPLNKVENIKNIWKKWHLNDLKAGTILQEKALKKSKWKGVNANYYSEQVEYLKKKNLHEDRGYKFGTSWLVEELPESVENKIKKLLK